MASSRVGCLLCANDPSSQEAIQTGGLHLTLQTVTAFTQLPSSN